MHITDLVTLIDHTTATILLEFVDNFKRTGRGIATIVGLDKLRARSHAEASMRVSAAILAQERTLILSPTANTRVERRGWWTSWDQVAVTAADDEHPIRLASGHIRRLSARVSRSLFRAVRGFSGRTAAPASSNPIEEAGSPSETVEDSLAASDDPRDLLE